MIDIHLLGADQQRGGGCQQEDDDAQKDMESVTGVFADGGRFHISGGHFTDTVMFNNGNDNAALEIDLYGDAVIDDLEYMIYVDDGSPATHMTINDRVRVGDMLFAVVSDGVLNYSALTVNGGYFHSDPRTWRDEIQMDANALVIAWEPEQYSGQADWEADSAVYPWRVKQETRTLVLPASLAVIGESAFENCGASEVYILDGCTTIGPNAFKVCGYLRAVHIPASVTSIDGTAFDGCSANLYIYGEKGSAAETFCGNHSLHFREESTD